MLHIQPLVEVSGSDPGGGDQLLALVFRQQDEILKESNQFDIEMTEGSPIKSLKHFKFSFAQDRACLKISMKLDALSHQRQGIKVFQRQFSWKFFFSSKENNYYLRGIFCTSWELICMDRWCSVFASVVGIDLLNLTVAFYSWIIFITGPIAQIKMRYP